MLGGNLGSLLYGDVSMMDNKNCRIGTIKWGRPGSFFLLSSHNAAHPRGRLNPRRTFRRAVSGSSGILCLGLNLLATSDVFLDVPCSKLMTHMSEVKLVRRIPPKKQYSFFTDGRTTAQHSSSPLSSPVW